MPRLRAGLFGLIAGRLVAGVRFVFLVVFVPPLQGDLPQVVAERPPGRDVVLVEPVLVLEAVRGHREVDVVPRSAGEHPQEYVSGVRDALVSVEPDIRVGLFAQVAEDQRQRVLALAIGDRLRVDRLAEVLHFDAVLVELADGGLGRVVQHLGGVVPRHVVVHVVLFLDAPERGSAHRLDAKLLTKCRLPLNSVPDACLGRLVQLIVEVPAHHVQAVCVAIPLVQDVLRGVIRVKTEVPDGLREVVSVAQIADRCPSIPRFYQSFSVITVSGSGEL
ncbi:hypothetical protein [Salinigranum marinum]|uniref:hypothetical protein n=1 Tax=Salinigranum marinum TaxID=1515595 RepID=UPI002989D004|nr:hypothetical protein [Salinigranum marinum]